MRAARVTCHIIRVLRTNMQIFPCSMQASAGCNNTKCSYQQLRSLATAKRKYKYIELKPYHQFLKRVCWCGIEFDCNQPEFHWNNWIIWICSFTSRNSHHKNKTVLYHNRNPQTWKDGLYIEMGSNRHNDVLPLCCCEGERISIAWPLKNFLYLKKVTLFFNGVNVILLSETDPM